MRRLIVGFFASIGFLVFALVAVGIGVWLFAGPREKPLAERNVLLVDLSRSLPDGAPQAGVERVLLGEETSLRDVLDAIERGGSDPRIGGMVARIGDGITGSPASASRHLRRAARF